MQWVAAYSFPAAVGISGAWSKHGHEVKSLFYWRLTRRFRGRCSFITFDLVRKVMKSKRLQHSLSMSSLKHPVDLGGCQIPPSLTSNPRR